MDTEEYLLISTENSQNWSAALYNYKTTNLIKTYKNGGQITPKTLNIVGNDYILTAEQSKPLLHAWHLNSQDIAKNVRLILPEPANCMTLCPKNVYLCVGLGCKVYIWGLNGKLFSITKSHYQAISNMVFSSCGQYFAVGGQDGLLLIYRFSDLVSFQNNFLSQKNLGQVEALYTINHHSMPITGLFAGKFGLKSRLVSVSLDQSCRVYNFTSGQLLLTLILNEPITSVIFDNSCWNLYLGLNSGLIKQYNLKKPPRTLTQHIDKETKDFLAHKKKVTCLDINLTNNILCSGSDDNLVLIWEIKSQQILKKFEYIQPITNIKFVLAYNNFTIENFKPKLLLKPLERSLDSTTPYTCSIYQNEDINLSDDENDFRKDTERQTLKEENRRLRTINKQLYNVALQISKKL